MEPPTVSVAVHIAATPARVWDLVTEIALMPTFSDELQSVQWLDNTTTPRVGACFEGLNCHPQLGTWTTRSHVVEYTPPTVFAWAVGDPKRPAATWLFKLNAAGHAATGCVTPHGSAPAPRGSPRLYDATPMTAHGSSPTDSTSSKSPCSQRSQASKPSPNTRPDETHTTPHLIRPPTAPRKLMLTTHRTSAHDCRRTSTRTTCQRHRAEGPRTRSKLSTAVPRHARTRVPTRTAHPGSDRHGST